MQEGIVALLLMIGRLAFFFFGENKKREDKAKEIRNDLKKAHKNKDASALIDALDRANSNGLKLQ